jgi:hypothetical protein
MNAHDILFYGNRNLLESLERIPPDQRNTTGVVGWWSARECMAHLAIFEEELVEVLESVIGDGHVPAAAQMSPDMNDILVAQRDHESFDQLMQEYQNAHTRVMELIEQIPPEKLGEVGTIPWYGEEYSLDDFLVYTYYGHKREHAGRFEMFDDLLKEKSK